MRPAEIRHVDLDVVAVIFGELLVGLAEDEFLLRADRDVRRLAAAVCLDLGVGAEDFLVEAGDPVGRPGRHRVLDIRNAEIDLAKALLVRLVDVELVAPGAGRRDVIVVFLELEFRVLQLLLDPLQPVQQPLAVGAHNPDMPAQHERVAGRQVELAPADIHPHIVGAGKEIGIAGKAAAQQVEIARQPLVRDFDIDVFQRGDVAEALGLAIERVFHSVLRHFGAPRRGICGTKGWAPAQNGGARPYQNRFSMRSSTGTR